MNFANKYIQEETMYYDELQESINASVETRRYDLDKPNPNMSALPAHTLQFITVGYGKLHQDYPVELVKFGRRNPTMEDVVIDILYCGVCHSDWHVLRNEWKNSKFPIVVGHEIVGKVRSIGAMVKKVKVGDFVGVGPNFDSCQICPECEKGQEQYCINGVTETYNMPERYPGEYKATGPISQGGYSDVIVIKDRYVIKLPDNIKLAETAPLLCAGITMYTPLIKSKLSTGSRVGIAGIGGLGHVGVKIGKSLGYEIIGLTTNPDKLVDGFDLGVDQMLSIRNLTHLDPYKMTFDLIVCTVPFIHDMTPYLELLKMGGILWVVGSLYPMTVDFEKVIRKNITIRGTTTGSISETQEFINYCSNNNIYPNIELISPKDINTTHEKIVTGQVRYRYVIDMSLL